ncbi:major intrinsic protein superfamily membrane channel protein [Suillus ampliporus]|nr:major intrinsic protein superfamily membrane channel protein [Suillus ampliporus]
MVGSLSSHPPTQRRSDTLNTSYATRGNDVSPISVVDFADCDQCAQYPNRWSKIREHICAPAAEFMSAFILCLFGCGGNCQTNLSANTRVSASPAGVMTLVFSSVDIFFTSWSGLALGVWISANYSGGHANPAVTIAFATVRGFPWKKVPIYYILAQVLGALCESGVVYATYYHAINLVEGGSNIHTIGVTGDLFATYAFIGAAMLITGISISALGMDTGAALNPARDLGPRILTAMVGYGREVFNFRNQYWLWCPILGPIFWHGRSCVLL